MTATKQEGLGRSFYALLTAAAISTVGDGARAAAIPLLAAHFTQSPFLISVVNFAGWLPWLTLALFSGVLVDRWDRRRVMVSVDGTRAVLVLLLAVLAATSLSWLAAVAVLAFALGVGETFFDPAAQALLPAVVKQEKLVTANSRLQPAQVVGGEFVGPPLGGLLFAVAAALPFIVDSASFAIAAILVATIRIPVRPQNEVGEERMVQAIRVGLRYLWGDRPIRTMALILGAWMFVDGGVYALLVLFALRKLHMGSAGFGLLLTASAVGTIIGSMLAQCISRALPGGYVLSAALACFGAAYLAVGTGSYAAVALAGFAVAGLASGVWNVVTVSFRQAHIPEHFFGRVISAYRCLAWGGTSLGSLMGGLVASAFGLRAPLLLAGTVILLLALVALKEFRHIVISPELEKPAADVSGPVTGSADTPNPPV